eukprot:TRINITY_DN1592_c0_g1_i2.p1 TRINITY_DN1592_c0_g1~~TRINITY_DN1592_c0_g1_i2.p1  ORF type:complete len:271 (-),score=70.13 TRINITY_DN1592_c0_g1_i2:179-991(-)
MCIRDSINAEYMGIFNLPKLMNTVLTFKDLGTYETLKYDVIDDSILHVQINRPDSLNAMNVKFFEDMFTIFDRAHYIEALRVVILTGNGKHFSAGLDLNDVVNIMETDDTKDTARKGIVLNRKIKYMQDSFTKMENLKVPVLVGVHNACIGGAIDMISACCVRYCTEDSKFSVKEVDVGMVADLGTIQRFPLIVGNESLVRELAYTGRIMKADEAARLGLVSRVLKTKEEMLGKTQNEFLISYAYPRTHQRLSWVLLRRLLRRLLLVFGD